jgi:hypothetical protein
VNAALLLVLLMIVEQLQRTTSGVKPWPLLALAMLAMFGAKSTSLPVVLAGLIAALVVSSVLTRRIDRRAAGLTLVGIGSFAVGTPLFYGGGSHGIAVNLLAISSENGTLSRPDAALAAIYFLGFASTGAGLLALLVRKGYRRADNIFLLFVVLSGMGAGLTFHQQGGSEYYFVFVVLLPMLLGGTLGIHHLFSDLEPRIARRTAVTAFAGAVFLMTLVTILDHQLRRQGLSGSQHRQVFLYYVLPMLTVLVLAGLAALGTVLRARQAGIVRSQKLLPLALVLALAGIGAAPTLHHLPNYVEHPLGSSKSLYAPAIGPGGITAARWLRAHTDPDTLVATNAHCQSAHQSPCWARNFWMSGYSERQFLVEGWSYVSWSTVGKTYPGKVEDDITGPFWDIRRLAANDAAFAHPTAADLEYLRSQYGVRWLLVDKLYPVDLKALGRLADRRLTTNTYAVYQLR